MQIWIIRHAEPDKDGQLTPQGHREAQALARRLQALKPDLIYTSPLARARDTMRYSAQALGLAYHVEDWLQERAHWLIDQEGLGRSTWWDIHGHTLRQLGPALAGDAWRGVAPFNQGGFLREYDELCAASDGFLARHGYVRQGPVYRVTQANRLKIAVFCHGGFGLTWLAHLLMIPLPLLWAGFNLAPSSLTTVLLDERNADVATPRVLNLSDLSHLYADGVPRSFHGVKANTA